MPILIDGHQYELADSRVITRNHRSHPALIRRNEAHMTKRIRFARAVVVHTVRGTADGSLVDDIGEEPYFSDVSSADLAYTRYQANTTRSVSWHFTIDTDGSVAQSFDPATEACWHANQTNPFTVGIELVQGGKALHESQMAAFVALIDLLTGVGGPRIAIPRVYYPDEGVILETLAERNSGARICGVYGHRNVGFRTKTGAVSRYRGNGDPGNAPFVALGLAGYMRVRGEDAATWVKPHQREAGVPDDGIYGPSTREAASKKRTALWRRENTRPIDSLLRSKAIAG